MGEERKERKGRVNQEGRGEGRQKREGKVKRGGKEKRKERERPWECEGTMDKENDGEGRGEGRWEGKRRKEREWKGAGERGRGGKSQLSEDLLSLLYFLHRIFPESPRWLLNQNRHDDFIGYFKKSARVNRVPFPEGIKITADGNTVGTALFSVVLQIEEHYLIYHIPHSLIVELSLWWLYNNHHKLHTLFPTPTLSVI